jgi:oligopeptide transport system substrate-binding protein
MYRTLLGIAIILGAALGVVGLTFSASTDTVADYIFINGTEPKSLDPHLMTGQPEGRIADAIFEGLTYRDDATLRPQPGSAKSWTVSADGRSWTFTMRPEARWSDGRRVTAHDFAWSWRRLQDPQTASEYAYLLHMVAGAEEFNTYAAQVTALRGPVLEQLNKLIAANPEGVEPAAWAAFAKAQALADSLKGTPDPVLQQLLSGVNEKIDADRLAALPGAVAREAERKAERHAHVAAHFGVDEGVWAPDEDTLRVELVAATPYFLELTAFYTSFPVPRHVVEAPNNALDWFLPHKIATNGPFRLAGWKVNHKIRLEKSDTYWGKDEVHLRVIDALPIENVTTALNVYLSGEADWLPSNYPIDLVDELAERKDWYANPGLIVYFYRFNCTRKPFNDARVRKAVALAIDRNLIVKEILRRGEPEALHVCPPDLKAFGYDPPKSDLGFDPPRARALLAEAGYPGGRGFPKVGITFNTQDTHKRIAEAIADMLRVNLGISVEPLNQEWQAYQAAQQTLDYDMCRAGWIGDYVDPKTFLDLWVTNGGNNQTGWSNATFDRIIRGTADIVGFGRAPDAVFATLKEPEKARALLAAAKSATEPAKSLEAWSQLRMHLFREAEAILVQDEVPVMPIYFYVVSGLVSPRVKGFHPFLELPDGSRPSNLQDLHPFRTLRVEPKSEETARPPR